MGRARIPPIDNHRWEAPTMSEVREAVRSRYANVAKQIALTPIGTLNATSGCCQADGPDCGCSGSYGAAGLDVLISARRVAPGGHAYGVDMTDEMLALANANRDQSGVRNATFLKGTIENVPLPDSSVDVVISNCVINLAEDKAAAIKEAFRVLRPGGLFAVADMVELEPLDATIKNQLDSWAGCLSGTIPIEEYRAALVEAGFRDPDFNVHATEEMPGVDGKVGSAYIRARKP